MTKGSESVRQMHTFLEDVDWDLVQEAADLGETAFHYVRRHPWLLVAAGTVLSALGAWQMVENRRDRHHVHVSTRDELDFMAP